jgi:hypothetical protein
LRLCAWAWKLFLFLLLLCGLPAFAAPRFDHYLLKGPCQFKEIITQDLDHDGRADVLATCVAGNFPNYKRSLALFRQRPNGSFAEAPDQMIALDRQAALVDVADVLPDPGQEILLLGPEGVRVLTQSQGQYSEPKPFISHPTFVALADPRLVPVWDFARDWDGDGQDEILLPGFNSLALYQSPSSPPQELHLPVRPTIMPTYRPGSLIEAKFTLWDIQPLDFDGDKKTDLIAVQDDQIFVFKQLEAGKFATEPDPRIVLNLWPEKIRQEREIRPLTQALAPDYYIMIGDYDHNGKADFLTLTLTGGFIGLVSETRIYFGGDPNLLRGQPSQKIVLKDAGAGPYLIDLDRDGKQELLLSYAAVTVANAARTVLSGHGDVLSQCYHLGPDGHYADQPGFVYKSTLKMNLRTVTQEGTLPIFQGDFNGDGKIDIFQGVSKEEAQIVLQRDGSFDHAPDLKFPCPISIQQQDNPRFQDLDGDHLADIAAVYPREPEHAEQIHVFMNRGGW